MATYKLEEMDFFQLRLLKNKKGTLYIRDGRIYIYHNNDKITVESGEQNVTDFSGDKEFLEQNLLGNRPDSPSSNKIGGLIDTTKDIKLNGHFKFQQDDDIFILCFVGEAVGHKRDVFALRVGKATDSI